MAQLYELPVLFVLENNKYAMGTSIERSSANTDLASRADSYAMAHSKVDGQDYFAVRAAAQEIVDNMREHPAPYFLEAITYRYSGHGAADGAEDAGKPTGRPMSWMNGRAATRWIFSKRSCATGAF